MSNLHFLLLFLSIRQSNNLSNHCLGFLFATHILTSRFHSLRWNIERIFTQTHSLVNETFFVPSKEVLLANISFSVLSVISNANFTHRNQVLHPVEDEDETYIAWNVIDPALLHSSFPLHFHFLHLRCNQMGQQKSIHTYTYCNSSWNEVPDD